MDMRCGPMRRRSAVRGPVPHEHVDATILD